MQIPDNLKAEYAVAQNQKNSWPREYVIQLIERIATAEQTIAELRAEVERLKARCLIEEWIAHEDAGSMMSLTVQQHAMVFDAIIAARAASTKGEDNAGTN